MERTRRSNRDRGQYGGFSSLAAHLGTDLLRQARTQQCQNSSLLRFEVV